MTRSIFDPGSGETERSGSRFGPEAPQNRSRMPPDAVDGEVAPAEAVDAQAVSDAEAAGLTPAERIEAIPEAEADAPLAGGGDETDPRGNP